MQMDEKGYSDDDDDASSKLDRNKSNNFMHEVHRQRKQSFSRADDSASDSPQTQNYNDSFEKKSTDYLLSASTSQLTPNFSPHLSHPHINIMKRQNTESMMSPNERPRKLERRHSADKVLSKPSHKNVNSPDYLNRMVISLRSKITTYKEDLRIAGELGQKLFSQNAVKDQEIEQYKTEFRKLKQQNEELNIVKDQLYQTTQLDDIHRKRLETDLNRQRSSHTVRQSQFEEENIRLRESLESAMADVRQLNLETERQRLEISTLDTRNSQNIQNSQEVIDDLSAELAEKTDAYSILKEKYQETRGKYTSMKIKCDKRGTEIDNLKKENQEKNLKILEFQALNLKNTEKANDDKDGANKQQIKLLYRQLENTKDEMEGISKHLDYCKQYLKTTMTYLESTGLKMKQPLNEDNNLDAQEIYNLCKNARQFLGIDKPPPDIVYPTKEATPAAPDLPTERTPGPPLPNDDEALTPSAPKERTPPLKVSQREIVPLQPEPAAPKQPTPPPSKPNNIPSQPMIPPSKPSFPKPIAKIKSKPMIPSIPTVPEVSTNIPPSTQPTEPQKPHLPLPRPKTPKKAPKTYNLGLMPTAVNLGQNNMSHPSLPAPAAPTNRHKAPPSLPEVSASKPKPVRFSSAMQPKQPKQSSKPSFFPSAPNAPQQPAMPSMPSTPPQLSPRVKTKINATASMPPDMAPPAPRTPSFKATDIAPPQPHLPSPAQFENVKSGASSNNYDMKPKPKSKTHTLGVMPANVDEKPMEFPSVPPSLPTNKIVHPHPSLPPQEPEPKPSASINAKAMAPPKPIDKPQSPPPMPMAPSDSSQFVPSPTEQKEPQFENIKSGASSNNQKPKRTKKKSMAKKKKSKKVTKKKDTIEEQKQHLTLFFMTYSDAKNW
eukprot:CAMPEP_0201576406 /NCGR_PEP_ID=MMETSP0190_2-20130828/22219_1 /ASSEMBLY_ACC=CAM_ASM_000263 /TAXON_ID=37353 /ORGANISM="Rosalina sp." /LENGTH=885 /DNA_ID=CAMNT_0048007261 /DNA_START=116 /DNA_END=2770 /DNA_ORIENTATION=+